MSNLPGNPHAHELLLRQSAGNQHSPTVEATLAVAYELRTANLQAERSWATGEGDSDRIYELDDQIQARLGAAK